MTLIRQAANGVVARLQLDSGGLPLSLLIIISIEWRELFYRASIFVRRLP
jgi:hypothetical protein